MPDPGHENLIRDLEELLQGAKAFEFHDFKNEKHAAPKVALYKQLHYLAEQVKRGRYDNDERS